MSTSIADNKKDTNADGARTKDRQANRREKNTERKKNTGTGVTE